MQIDEVTVLGSEEALFTLPGSDREPWPLSTSLDDLEDDSLFLTDYEDNDDVPYLNASKYEFRRSIRKLGQGLGSTWVDQDLTGNYNPSVRVAPEDEAKKLPERVKRPAYAPLDDDTLRQKRVYTARFGRWIGLQIPICIKIISEKGKGQLKEIKQKYQDKWPLARHCSDTNFTDLHETFVCEQRLRRRALHRHHSSYPDSPSPPSETSLGELTLGLLTLGHPEARGCKDCFVINIPCSLVQGGSYPCSNCQEDQRDCELVLEPSWKASCICCCKRRLKCSFSRADDHRGRCDECAASRFKCIAGPASGRTRTGPALGQDNTFLAQRKQRSSKDNTLEGSIKETEDEDEYVPAKPRRRKEELEHVLVPDVDTDVESVNRQHHTRSLAFMIEEVLSDLHARASATNEAEAMDVEAQAGASVSVSTQIIGGCDDAPVYRAANIKTIRARLAHPVQVNQEPSESTVGSNCHWCDDLAYGLLGLPEKQIEVIDRGESGYEELEKGHVADGNQPSRMCTQCTLERVITACCEGHLMEALPDDQDVSFQKILSNILDGEARQAPWTWCSVCPSKAISRCVTKQDDVHAGGFPSGCGLVLCRSCTLDLQTQGDLLAMVEKKEREADNEFSTRADAGLFKHIIERL